MQAMSEKAQVTQYNALLMLLVGDPPTSTVDQTNKTMTEQGTF